MPSHSSTSNSTWTFRVLVVICVLLLVLVYQNLQRTSSHSSPSLIRSPSFIVPTSIGSSGLGAAPPALPSVRLSADEEAKVASSRHIYGGKGDKLHLGGFTERDPQGLSDNVFNYMLGPLGIKSVIDVGCGKGISTKEFQNRGARVLCVEGSHDAVQQSLLSKELVVEHDFTRGPWWPSETYDAAWSVEFLEHVGRPYMLNYLPVFKKCALIFVTSSGFGGWHHVEVHEHYWWQARMEAQGFVYSADLTERVRLYAKEGKTDQSDAQHLQFGMRVFINPRVASLPQHHHLLAGWGCTKGVIDNRDGGKECEGVDALPSDYVSLLDCRMDMGADKKLWECQPNPKATIPAPYTKEV